jgi:putative restriction endonuclease
MVRRNWTRDELIVAFNLYCKIPFSKISARHPMVISLAEAIGRTPSAVAWKLVNFATLDPSLQARNIKGASNTGKMDKVIFDEFIHNWDELAYESEIALANLVCTTIETPLELDSSLEQIELKEGKVKEVITKARVNQNFFRKMILSSYENKCCITGMRVDSLLVASHIIPWAKDEANRTNPENGLCLNSLHDKAFDVGLITIDTSYQVRVSKHISDFENDTSIQKFFLDYDRNKITLPKRFLPKLEFLDYHQANIFKG